MRVCTRGQVLPQGEAGGWTRPPPEGPTKPLPRSVTACPLQGCGADRPGGRSWKPAAAWKIPGAGLLILPAWQAAVGARRRRHEDPW